MSIIVHHLNNSRSQRVLWLLEELALDYEIKRYEREALRHLELMHFSEGSVMTPVLLQLYTAKLGDAAAPLAPRIADQLAAHFGYMEHILRPAGHFIGDDWTGADVMLSFPAEVAIMQGDSAKLPKLAAFVSSIHALPAWQRACAKGGAYFAT